MGALLVFIIKTNIILACLLLVYRCMLAHLSIPAFNRSLLLSFLCVSPAAVALWDLFSSPHSEGPSIIGLSAQDLADMMIMNGIPATVPSGNTSIASLIIILWIIVAAAIAIASLTSLFQLLSSLRKCRTLPTPSARLYITDIDTTPFSFGSSIVMSRNDFEQHGAMILAHETAHISRRHTVDLILAQIFCIVSWFSPAAWMLKTALSEVHEYQADNDVLRLGFAPYDYQMLLIRMTAGSNTPLLTNNLNHNNLKNRILMMQKSNSGKASLKALTLLPTLAGALILTSIPVVASTLGSLASASILPSTTEQLASTTSSSPTRQTPALGDAEAPAFAVTADNAQGETAPTTTREQTETAESATPAPTKIDAHCGLGPDGKPEPIIYKVNGEEITYEQLRRIDADDIASMNVDKSGDIPVIHITTKAYAATHSEPGKVEVAPQKMAEFPDGMAGLMRWICTNLRFPDLSPEEMPTEAKKVVIAFTVNTDGKVTDPEIMRSQGEAFDNEARRLITIMPNWTPAENDGQPVASRFTLPITFKVQ